MATVNDRRRLAYGAMRQFWFDAPGGVASVPPHLRDKSAGGWFFGQSLDPTGRYVLDDLHLGTPRAVQPGRCANFDGVDDRIDIGNVANIGIGGFSVSLWVKSNTATTRVMVAKNDTLAATQGRWGFHIASGKAYGFVSYYNGSTADTVVATGGANVNDDVWHHVTMTFDRVDVKVYVDGVIANTASASAIPVAADLTNAVTLQIGAANSATYMIGKMFDVRIYNRALTPEEVASIHATSKPGGRPEVALIPSNLVGHWKLDDGLRRNRWSTIAFDSSGNGYHGGVSGSASTFHYEGNDVPFSWQNEVGYSPESADPWRTFTDVWIPKFDTWTAFGTDTGKSVALTGQSWGGRTGLYAAKFVNGALGNDRLLNRVSTEGTDFTANGSKLLVMVADIALSRPLVGSEGVRLSFNGGNGGGVIVLDQTDGAAKLGDVTKFQTFTGTTTVFNANTTQFLEVFPVSNVTGGDLTVYVDNVRYYEAQDATDNGPLDFKYTSERAPQNSAIPSQDIFGNTLTYTGSVPRNAKLIDSHCGTFDGTDDGAATAARVTSGALTTFTASAWIKTSTVGKYIISEWDSGTSNYSWALHVDASGGVAAFVSGTVNGSVYRARVSTATVADGAWHHVAMVYESGEISVYIDGVAAATTLTVSGTVAAMANSTAVFRVGRAAGAGLYFNGQISEPRVYTSALSASDVANLYAGKDITATPVGHWPIAEGDGTTLYDVSGNANHATLTGISVASFWGTRQSLNHRNIRRGFRVANATGSGRTFSGSSQYFEGAYNSSYDVANNPAWFAAYVKSSGAEGYRAIFGPQKTNQHTWRVYYHGGVHKYALACVNAASSLVVATTEVVTWASGAWDFVFGYHDPVSDTISIALNGSAFVPLAFSGGLISRSNDMQVGIGEGVSGWIGDMGLLAFGKPASTPASWTAIRDAIYNGGSPLQYADLTATQKTDWGLVSWWDCNEHSRYLYDSHGSNDLLGVGIPYVPALTSLASAADGGTINCPAGQHHNQAETRIDFTGGVPAAPWTDGLTVPDSYDYHEAPAGLKKATQRVGGTESERDFYILLAE